jgi:hypothetical protein
MTDDDLTRMLALDGEPGPALAIEPADASALVDRALAGAGFGPAGGPAGGAHGGGLAGGTKVGLAVLAVAGAVVIALLVMHRGHGTRAVVAPPDAAIDAAIDGSPGSAELGSASTDDLDDIELDPEPGSAAQRARPHRPETREAADLLGEANAKRAAKQWRESDALYTRVVRRAPKSLAAQTALVASASLHLEHLADPRGASRRFSRALAIAPDGALAEEARWGLAEAARARHDDAAEARALDDFLAHHAGSPLAARARARRSELP